jgi:hypothetical protein
MNDRAKPEPVCRLKCSVHYRTDSTEIDALQQKSAGAMP